MPDPDRPSGAPLSDRDADLLSERFTASWDEPIEDEPPKKATAFSPPRVQAAPAPAAAPPVVAPPPPVAINPAKPKATLLGIAPIVSIGPTGPISKPPSAPPPADPAITARMPAVATPAPAAAAAPARAVAPVPAQSAAPAPAPSVAPAPAPSVAPAPTPSSPESSSVAQGLTTPSKPYIPKDHPSTPAVVISEGLVDDRAKAERARIAQTLPAQTRVVPLEATVQQRLRSDGSAPATSTALDDTYSPARGRKSKLPLALGGLALAGLAAFVVLQVTGSGGSGDARSAASADQQSPVTASTPPPLAAQTQATAALTEPANPNAATSPPPTEAAPLPPPEDAPPPPAATEPAAPKKAAARPRKAAPAPKRVTTKAPAEAAASKAAKPAAAPATEPAPAPKPASGKGVIVRETPF